MIIRLMEGHPDVSCLKDNSVAIRGFGQLKQFIRCQVSMQTFRHVEIVNEESCGSNTTVTVCM